MRLTAGGSIIDCGALSRGSGDNAAATVSLIRSRACSKDSNGSTASAASSVSCDTCRGGQQINVTCCAMYVAM